MDLIDRQAAIAYAISGRVRTLPTSEGGENWIRTEDVRQSLSTMPSAHGDAEFISWLLDEIWDDEMWELNYRAFPELLCRRLVKAGWLKEEDGKYVRLDK